MARKKDIDLTVIDEATGAEVLGGAVTVYRAGESISYQTRQKSSMVDVCMR